MLDRMLIGAQYRPIEVRLAERRTDLSVERTAEGIMPTSTGNWNIVSFRDKKSNDEHVAIFKGNILTPEPLLTRLHSSCLTAEVFTAVNCDCKEQMEQAMQTIAAAQRGIIVYLHQEGRGNGLAGKLLQLRTMMEQQVDTVAAFEMTGQQPERRDYTNGVDIYRDLGVMAPLCLLTHNPGKIEGLRQGGFEVRVEDFNVPLNSSITYRDVLAKRDRLGHVYGKVEL